jgi:hypothetical protein
MLGGTRVDRSAPWAFSIPTETPPCSDQLIESSAAHAAMELTIAVLFKASSMDFSVALNARAPCARDQTNGMRVRKSIA